MELLHRNGLIAFAKQTKKKRIGYASMLITKNEHNNKV